MNVIFVTSRYFAKASMDFSILLGKFLGFPTLMKPVSPGSRVDFIIQVGDEVDLKNSDLS